MINDLEHRLGAYGEELERAAAHRRRIWSGERETSHQKPQSHKALRRLDADFQPSHAHYPRLAVIGTAFVLAIGVGALITTRLDNGRNSSAEQAEVTALPARPEADADAIGVFPGGGIISVIRAGYDTPMEVVDAYLESRTDPTLVPFGTRFEYSIHDIREIDDNHAIVYFGLGGDGDGSDGHAEVFRVVHANAEAWVVAQAFVVPLEIPSMTYRDGTLTGASAGGPYSTNVYVRDAVTGDVLDEQRYPLFPPNTVDQPRGTPIESSGLAAPSLSVLVWLTGFDPNTAAPIFGEFVIRDGEHVVTGSRVLSTPYYVGFQMFANPTVSHLDALNDGETVEVYDGNGLTITASRDVPGHTYCVEVIAEGSESRTDCWPLSKIAAGDARNFVGPIVYRIVPDHVTVTESGQPVEVTNNVWFAFTDENGNPPRSKFTDGRATQTEGGPPASPPE